MRVVIGPYRNWIGPYQIADKIFFWCEQNPEDKLEERWDYKAKDWFGEFLAHGFNKRVEGNDAVFGHRRHERPKTWFYRLLSWIHSKKKRKIEVKLDYYDHWNVDETLSPIILPLLKELKKHRHGSGYIDLEDVPEHMRTTTTEEYDAQSCFDFYHEDTEKHQYDIHDRYDWVLSEMIWAFEQLQPDYDWEDQYSQGEIDMIHVPCRWDADGKTIAYEMKAGPEHTYEIDWEGRTAHQKRIDNGLRLFGKYYSTLWS